MRGRFKRFSFGGKSKRLLMRSTYGLYTRTREPGGNTQLRPRVSSFYFLRLRTFWDFHIGSLGL